MLGGMQSHLDSSVVRVRRMGMVVGECLSSRMDVNGAKLKFEVQYCMAPFPRLWVHLYSLKWLTVPIFLFSAHTDLNSK